MDVNNLRLKDYFVIVTLIIGAGSVGAWLSVTYDKQASAKKQSSTTIQPQLSVSPSVTQTPTSYYEYKMGDTVTSGNFAYKVTAMAFGKRIGNEYYGKTADGTFLLVKLKIKNLEHETRVLDHAWFHVSDQDGNTYDASSEGAMIAAAAGDHSIFLKQCQPNIPTIGVLVFEVPTSKKQYRLFLSGGFGKGAPANIILHK